MLAYDRRKELEESRRATMNHCSINLEDTDNGEIAMKVHHAEGFNPRSPAHKLAIQIVKWLDEQATSKKDLALPDQDDPSHL